MNIPNNEDFEKAIDELFTNLMHNEMFEKAVTLEDNGSFLNRIEMTSMASEAWTDTVMKTLRDIHPHEPIPDNVMQTLQTLIWMSISMSEHDLLAISPEKIQAKRQQSE